MRINLFQGVQMKKSVFIISAVALLLLFLLGTAAYKSDKLDKSAKAAGQNLAFLARKARSVHRTPNARSDNNVIVRSC